MGREGDAVKKGLEVHVALRIFSVGAGSDTRGGTRGGTEGCNRGGIFDI